MRATQFFASEKMGCPDALSRAPGNDGGIVLKEPQLFRIAAAPGFGEFDGEE